MKKKAHSKEPTDLALNSWEFQLVMGEDWEHRHVFLESIFCDCSSDEKMLVDYQVYLNHLNDLVLKGKCSACGSLAARYIETGEKKENYEAAERIRKQKKK